MRQVCVVVTARPSYSRIWSVLQAVKAHADLKLQLVVGASALLDRYGNMVEHIISDGFEIDTRIHMVMEGENPAVMAKTTGVGLMELATAFDNLRPDVVVTVADRYETLASAVAASYMNIPLAHVQGGEVTGSVDDKVRHAVTKLSNLHFVSTQKAAERVICMGEDPATVFVTGCPSIELAAQVLADGHLNFDPYKKYGGVGETPDLSAGYLVVLQHPVTTEYEQARQHVTETIRAVDEMGLGALWFWPNVDAGSDGTSDGIRTFREIHEAANIHFFKNMAPLDFLRLVSNSRCILGNSSVAIRECAFLGVPAVNIGTRQAGRERGRNVVDVGYDQREIVDAVHTQLRKGKFPSDPIYGDSRAGQRIAELMATLPLTTEKRLTY